MDFNTVTQFEQALADFWGAEHAVAVDSCTHGIELCFRMLNVKVTTCPAHTYISVPFTLMRLNIDFVWSDTPWTNWYRFGNTHIIDAATFWRKDGFVPYHWMVLSFQHQKALKLGRGGAILLNDSSAAKQLRRMAHDGRERGIPWAEQKIDTIGYHYYMTPETAAEGLRLLPTVDPDYKAWDYSRYPYLPSMPVFNIADQIIL